MRIGRNRTAILVCRTISTERGSSLRQAEDLAVPCEHGLT
jgi:hypothetical protein